jgi:hypothetical protein
MALAVLLAVPAVALADIVVADGDGVVGTVSGTRDLGSVNPGATLTPNVDFYLSCDGNQHFNSNDSADIDFTTGTITDNATNTVAATGSATATSLTGLSGPSSGWPADTSGGGSTNCTASNTDRLLNSSTATIVAPKKAGTYTIALDYTVDRATSTTQQELRNNITNEPLSFTLTVDNVAPANVTLTGDTAATEGDIKTYTVSATDANDDSLTYDLVKSSTGGADVSITRTPDPNDDTKVLPDSFDVEFLTSGSVDLRASASDGTATSYSQDKTVSVASANTAPEVTLSGPNDGDSYEFGSVPSATCDVTDAEDGNSSPAAELSAITGPLSAYGLGSQTATCSYTDQGGLADSDSVTYTIVDTTRPVIVYKNATTNPNANNWYNADVTANFEATDAVGLASGTTGLDSTGKKANFSQTTTGQGASVNVSSGTVTDVAGNVALAVNSANYKIDKTDPSVAYQTGSATPAANTAGWNNTDVTVTFEATDTLSGMGATDAIQTATNTATTSGEGTNVSVGSPAFTDRAGNTAPANTATSPDFKIDKTKPVVSVTGVSHNGTYTYGNVPTPGCDTQPGLSGVKTAATLSVTGGTGGFGTLTATCSGAVDNADNNQAAPVIATYTVSGTFNGWLQPVDGDGGNTTVNVGKAGRTYPIKWQIKDSSNALISDTTAQLLVGTMTGGQAKVNCGAIVGEQDVLEEYNSGSTALRYDALSDQFIYNYKAPTTPGCYTFAIKNADGAHVKQANFNFTK